MFTGTPGHLRTDSESTLHCPEASTSSLSSMSSRPPLRARAFNQLEDSSSRSVTPALPRDGIESRSSGRESSEGDEGRSAEDEERIEVHEGLMLVQEVSQRLSSGSSSGGSTSDRNKTVTSRSQREAVLNSEHYEQGSGLDAYEWSQSSTPSVSSSSTTPALSSSHSNASFDWTTTGSCGVMTPPPGRELASLGLQGNFLSLSAGSKASFDSIDKIGSNEGKELIVDEDLDWELEGIRRGRGRKSSHTGFAF